MMGALGAAPDQPGRLAGVFEGRVLVRWLQHSLDSALYPGQADRLPAADRATMTLAVAVAFEALRDIPGVLIAGRGQGCRGRRRAGARAEDQHDLDILRHARMLHNLVHAPFHPELMV